MKEDLNDDLKNKEFIPTDDITIEFVEHEEVHKVTETPENIIEGKSVNGAKKEESEDKLKLAEDKILRLRADFENYKRRTSKEWSEKETRSQMEILRQILPFVDNLQRAMQNVPEGVDKNWFNGVELSVKDFFNLLEKFGLKEINDKGVQFDPSIHESIGFDSVDDLENNSVAKIVQKGYLFRDRLLRPAKVLINKKSVT